MHYRKKLIFLLGIVLLVVVLQLLLPGNSSLISFYSEYIFDPYQAFRNLIFGKVFLSIGDLLYVFGIITVIGLLIRWVFFLIRFKSTKSRLLHSFFRTLIAAGVLYVLFFIGWGGNYYKPSLSEHWGMDRDEAVEEHFISEFDQFLITQLNRLAPEYREIDFREVNQRARQYFKEYVDSRFSTNGVRAKASIFGYLLQYFGIQGYYNPFTGEAQVNHLQPSFMLPFVVAHEMAHQTGIAAEDDANLLAYVLGSSVADPVFQYSAYFNIWLYTHWRLRAEDSLLAEQHRGLLNPITTGHLDTLRQIRNSYRSNIASYTGFLYDSYLRLHQQSDGIHSYNKVVTTAWMYEKRRKAGETKIIDLP